MPAHTQADRRRLAATTMRVDQVTAETSTALRAGGVAHVLLKGPTTARWLYDPGELRVYSDTDLLVAPGRLDVAERALSEIGFRPGQSAPHGVARSWHRGSDAVDLHRSLIGIGASDESAWTALTDGTEPLAVAGTEVTMLGPPARALHIALHAAQHGTRGKHIDDLERALGRLNQDLWAQAHELAIALEAEGAFSAGLRQLPAGARIADALGAHPVMPAGVALRAGTPPAGALGVAHLAEARGVRARLKVLARGIAPSPAYMRRWSPAAARGRLGLIGAYAWRPLWLAGRAPAAIAAWRRAARRSGG